MPSQYFFFIQSVSLSSMLNKKQFIKHSNLLVLLGSGLLRKIGTGTWIWFKATEEVC